MFPIPNRTQILQTKKAFDKFSLPTQGKLDQKFIMASGIDGGKFTTEEDADTVMEKMGYNNYIVTSNNDILFNPIIIA